ncbi:hypothetical protein OCU04_003753 [Sclerotinia nivalis]|uniref:Uncharacterized protein n=1 Tax=Sclerotinia nivalis TaxID=352851 RepID=A0A9X0ATH2_9HELO|nr:hypothetical protein OCU04_003753 [Sclerotinia nivalis]
MRVRTELVTCLLRPETASKTMTNTFSGIYGNTKESRKQQAARPLHKLVDHIIINNPSPTSSQQHHLSLVAKKTDLSLSTLFTGSYEFHRYNKHERPQPYHLPMSAWQSAQASPLGRYLQMMFSYTARHALLAILATLSEREIASYLSFTDDTPRLLSLRSPAENSRLSGPSVPVLKSEAEHIPSYDYSGLLVFRYCWIIWLNAAATYDTKLPYAGHKQQQLCYFAQRPSQ